MLVLSRKEGEKIRIGQDIVITITAIKGGRVKLGIEAPTEVPVLRGELQRTVDEFRQPPLPTSEAPVWNTLAAIPSNAR